MRDLKWNLQQSDLEVCTDICTVQGEEYLMQKFALRLQTPYFFGPLDWSFGSDLTTLVNSPGCDENALIRVVGDSLMSDPDVKDFDIRTDGDCQFLVEILLRSGEVVNVQIS